MSEIQFWVKNPNDEFRDFNTRLDPDGISLYSGNSPKDHSVGLFNDKTARYDKKYVHRDVNNIKYINSGSGLVDDFYTTDGPSKTSSFSQSSEKDPTISRTLGLLNIPNHASTMNVRFVSNSPSQVQSATVKITSGPSLSVSPSTVNFKMAQIMHPEMSAEGALGSGDSSWTDVPASTGVITKSLNDNPGISGISTGISSNRHDWYLALSAKSTDIGSNDFQMIFSLEYV